MMIHRSLVELNAAVAPLVVEIERGDKALLEQICELADPADMTSQVIPVAAVLDPDIPEELHFTGLPDKSALLLR